MTLRQCRSEENGRERKEGDEGRGKGGMERREVGLMRLFECFYFVAVREEKVNVVVGVH